MRIDSSPCKQITKCYGNLLLLITIQFTTFWKDASATLVCAGLRGQRVLCCWWTWECVQCSTCRTHGQSTCTQLGRRRGVAVLFGSSKKGNLPCHFALTVTSFRPETWCHRPQFCSSRCDCEAAIMVFKSDSAT